MEDKLVVIHQPDFMPYLGFFQRLIQADIYIVLDNVQYVRGSSKAQTSRDKIKTINGEKWINVGIQKTAFKSRINEIELSKDNQWRERSLNVIKENYRKADYFSEIYPYLETLYSLKCNKMVEFNMASINMLIELFGIEDIEIIFASELSVIGKNNELVIELVKEVGCHRYLSGTGARDYYIPELYEKAGIEVIWQKFEPPVYKQQFGEFIPYLSSIDLLLNCGIEHSREILRKC
ncbi:MAG: WbqC family protein [Lachnospiraceae bacterium]|nr:WbqC family protein [Lachnospiraceae bacterium]